MLIRNDGLSIFEPDHRSFGLGIYSAHQIGFVILSRIYSFLLHFDFWGIWKNNKKSLENALKWFSLTSNQVWA